MLNINNTILFIVAYLLGSIPTSLWIGRAFYGIDVRKHGSGNAGATNALRVLGAKAGIPVFIIDALKGWLASWLVVFSRVPDGDDHYLLLKIIFGVVAIVGHIYPVFAGFRGGKGVSTSLGVVIALHPLSTLILLPVFVLVLLITSYVSVSSMTCAFLFPILIIFVFKVTSYYLVTFSILIAFAVFITHRKNIRRLILKQEKKITFKKKPTLKT